MKRCSFEIETFFRVPFDYENEYESMMLELTDESVSYTHLTLPTKRIV